MTQTTVTTSFSGISDPTNWPPENGLAVGPAYVVTVESSKIEWTNLTGGAAFNESLYTLFSSLSASQRNSLLDARVAYDSVNGRFVVMAENLGSNESNIDIAVSKDSNPNDGWYVGSVSSLLTINGATTQADMPYLSVDGSKIYVSEAQYGSGFAGTQEWVFGDTAGSGGGIYNGGTLTTLASQVAPPSAGIARNVSNGQGLTYYVSVVPTSGQSVLTIQTYNSTTNAFSAATTLALGNSDKGASPSDYTIAQEGTSLTLDAYDSRIASLAYSNGFLYGLSEVENVGTSIPEIHWFKLNVSNPGAPTIAAQGDITGAAIGAGVGVFNGSLAVDAAGDMIVNFTASSANMFPADYYMVMPSGASSFGSPTLYQSSTSYYAQTANASGAQRWGTYSTAIADPNDPNGFWISNEYVTSSGITIPSGLSAWWDTVTAQVHVSPATSPPPPPPPAPVVTSITTSGTGISGGNGDLGVGKVVTFTVNFSQAVTVNTSGGSPTLSLSDTGSASYVGGSGGTALTFSYTVAAGQNSSDLTVSSFNTNGATVQNGTTAADLSGAATNPPGILQIDTSAPVVTISNTGGTVSQAAQTITGTVDVGDAGSTVTVFDSSTQAGTATVQSNGSWSTGVTLASGTNTLTANDTDAAGNVGTSNSVIYTLTSPPPPPPPAPVVTSITTSGTGISGGNGDLGVGKVVTFTVNFSQAVTVNTSGGSPTLSLSDTGSASYVGGSGGTALTFSYTVAAGQNSSDLTVSSFNTNGATVQNGTTAADLSGAATNPPGILQIDTSAPVVTISNTGGTVSQAAQTITGTVDVGDAGSTVTVFDSSTQAGTATVQSNGSWSTGVTLASGTNTLTANDTDAAGNVGTSNSVIYTLTSPPPPPPPAPVVTSITTSGTGISGGNGDLGVGKVVTFAVNFSQAVTVNTSGGSPTLSLSDTGSASYVGGSGGTALTFSYTVAAGQNSSDLTVSSFNTNGATVQNGTTAADLSGAATNPPGILQIDTSAPVVTISNTGGTVSQAAQTITGTVDVGDAGSTVTVFDSSTQAGTATVQSNGSWSTGVTLASGTNTLTANDTDAAGNVGTSNSVIYTLTSPPPPPPPAGRTISTSTTGPVVLSAASNPLFVTNTGAVTSTGSGTNGVSGATGTAWTVTNAGKISSSAGDGVSLASTSTINNSGTLSGLDAVALRAGGVLTNASGASISGSGTGVGVYISGSVGTVTNAGSITGAYHGMFITSGASVSNATSGFISGPHNGIVFKNQAGTISNSGTISGTGSGSTGVYLESNASANITNTSSGTISGSFGIFATAGGTVTNAGRISGSSYAIDFTSSGTNRLIVDPGAVFVGNVKANSGGTNTLELAGGSGTGSISGVGTSFTNFQTLAVDAGATWTLTGTNSAPTVLDAGSLDLAGTLNNSAIVVFQGSSSQLLIDNAATFGTNVGTSSYAGPLLEDFVNGDKIDLKNFSSTGASFSYNVTTGVLQLSNSSSQHASVEFQASTLGSASFQLASDGASGTFVTTAADNDASAEPPTLTIANTSLTVAAGGSISLGVTATPADSDDAVSVTVSGVPSYETISAPSGDNVTHQAGSSTWTISSTAGVSINGFTLTSSYSGTGQPVAALSVTANNTTLGETASSASQTLNVTDPPALTSTSPPSSTTNTAPVIHLAALFDQFVAAGFHNDHHSSVGQIASHSPLQSGEESLFLAHPHR